MRWISVSEGRGGHAWVALRWCVRSATEAELDAGCCEEDQATVKILRSGEPLV